MLYEKFTSEHYKDKIEYYKSELRCNILVEMSFEIFDNEPEVLEENDDDLIIQYVVRNYNTVNLYGDLSRYINAECFIAALGSEKKDFANELREMLIEEYHNQRDQWIEELIQYINGTDSTAKEKETARILKDDVPSLLIFLNNAYNVWLSKQYGDEYVMRLITNPEKLDLFISENKVLLDVITQTIEENLSKIEQNKEQYQNGAFSV